MTKDVLKDVITATSSKEVWDSLQRKFSSSTRARTVQICVELATTKKRDMTAADYYRKIIGLANELAAANATLTDDEVLSYLLSGLPAEYDPFVTSMTTKTDPITLDDVYAHLMAFEARQLQHQAELQLNAGASANYAGRGGHGDRGHGRSYRGRFAPRGGAPSKSSGGRGSSSRPPCQICGKVGHTAIKCWHQMDESYCEEPSTTALAATTSYKVDPNWYLDTGATDHITSDLDRLAIRERYHGGEKVHVGNGTGLCISHIGHSSINSVIRPLALRNILHVPDITKHLISVHKFSRDNDVFIEYHPWHFSIKDRQSKKNLLVGTCESGLYPITPSDAASLHHALFSRSPSRAQWHARLGHPSLQVVQSVLHLNNISCPSESSLPVCNACQLAKSHQLPYSSSIHRSTSPLEMIFSDFWGPAPQSVGGFKYYISFIDDFSKFSWIYLMHDRSEAPHIFLQIQTHVECLLNTKIKCVQSDWGGEYQKLHNTFFRSLGITYRVSCPHTHQQNGSAERKHRHIVETGLALLADAHIPLKFWDETFLTGTYLINRLPTRGIDNKCPLQRLFDLPPNYSMLKVFGCACWPHLRAYNKHKLAFRFKEYVFLGYSSLHKGYKCLDIDSSRIYISRDVIFDEDVFSFARTKSTPSQPQPDESSNLHNLHLENSGFNLNCDHTCIRLPANSLDAEDTLPPESAPS
jgi:hypothetical protein